MPSRKSAACTIALLTGLVWSACSSDPPLPLARTAGCTLNSDCSSPLACIFQRCHGVCTETRDCREGRAVPQARIPTTFASSPTKWPARSRPIVRRRSSARSTASVASPVKPRSIVSPPRCAPTASAPTTTSCFSLALCRSPTPTATRRADDGGNVVTGEGSAGSSDAGPDVSSTGTIDAGSDDGKAPTIDVSPDVAISPDAAIAPCGDGGVLSKFAPSNLPSGFAIPGDAGATPWVVTTSYCVFDTDTLTATGCGTGFEAKAVDLSDGRSAAVISAASVTVSTGARITFTGRRPAIVLANGKIDINGGVEAGQNATNGWFGGGAPGTPTGDRVGFCALETGPGGGGKGDSTAAGSGAGGGAFCGSGGRGSIRADAGAGAPGGAPYGRADLIPLVGGSGGGSSAGGFTAVQGTNHGGGAVELVAGDSIMVGELGVIDMGGGFAAVTVGSIEGGGGGSGGAVLLEAPSVTIKGVVSGQRRRWWRRLLAERARGAAQRNARRWRRHRRKRGGGQHRERKRRSAVGLGRSGGGGGGAGRIRINTGCGGSLTVTAAAVDFSQQYLGVFHRGHAPLNCLGANLPSVHRAVTCCNALAGHERLRWWAWAPWFLRPSRGASRWSPQWQPLSRSADARLMNPEVGGRDRPAGQRATSEAPELVEVPRVRAAVRVLVARAVEQLVRRAARVAQPAARPVKADRMGSGGSSGGMGAAVVPQCSRATAVGRRLLSLS